MDEQNTTRFGRYQLQDELGRGNAAVVYRGTDLHLQRPVALKLPLTETKPDDAREFLAEARAAAHLTHPNIITIYDFGVVEKRPFIAMELLSGRNLAEFVAQRGALGLRTIVKIAIQTADALAYAHARGVVHADVKPDNIAVINDQADIKLMDFGIAYQPESTQPTAGDYVAGTPHYMSPEQIGNHTLDGRSDLFSLGVILYWLLSGRTPFREHETKKLLDRIANEDAPRLKPRDLSTPQALIDMVHVLLQRDRNARYQNGQELLEHLRVVDEQLAAQERVRGNRRIIPLRWRWSVLMGGVVTLTMALGISLVQETQSRMMHDLVFDYGATLARVMATESVEDLLLEDRLALSTQVQSMQSNQEVVHLQVTDRHGTVIAAADPEKVGRVHSIEASGRLVAEHGGQLIYQPQEADDLLIFQAPVRFQDHTLGQLEVGVSTAALDRALGTSLWSMLALFAVTLLAVLFGVFWLARRLSIPLNLLQRAMRRMADGQFDRRIRLARNDEFARIFASFNAMADAIEARLIQARSAAEQSSMPPAASGADQQDASGGGTQKIAVTNDDRT